MRSMEGAFSNEGRMFDEVSHINIYTANSSNLTHKLDISGIVQSYNSYSTGKARIEKFLKKVLKKKKCVRNQNSIFREYCNRHLIKAVLLAKYFQIV